MSSDNYSYSPGEKVSLDADHEKRMIESGQAEEVKAEKPSKKTAKGK
jgi:hypothetical protein